jgi:hypothetical protein
MTRASIEAYNGDSRFLAGLINAGMPHQETVFLHNSNMDDTTKQRLLVMNGQRLVQSHRGGEWATDKVEKAGALKPGIYDIHLSTGADKSKSYDGLVVYADKDAVYQRVGKTFIKHVRQDFGKVPEIGSNSSIKYDDGKAITATSAVKLGRGISR